MTVSAKVALVEDVREEFGLTLPLRVLGLARSTWYYRAGTWQSYEEKHSYLRAPLERIARKHPEYGYRRATTELAEAYEEAVNHKVVQRLHSLWGLPLVRVVKPPPPSAIRSAIRAAGPRADLVAQLPEIKIFAVIYTDFTEITYGRRRAFLIVFLDHVSKLVLGAALGQEKSTRLALEAWARARRKLGRFGVPIEGRIVYHDRDPIFTSYAWLARVLREDGARVSYALRGPSDNPEMESFNGRFKVENASLFSSAQDFDDLGSVVFRRLRYYNQERRHSSLENRAPITVVQEFLARR